MKKDERIKDKFLRIQTMSNTPKGKEEKPCPIVVKLDPEPKKEEDDDFDAPWDVYITPPIVVKLDPEPKKEEDDDFDAPWDVCITPENDPVDKELDDKKNEKQHPSISENHQQSRTSLSNDISGMSDKNNQSSPQGYSQPQGFILSPNDQSKINKEIALKNIRVCEHQQHAFIDICTKEILNTENERHEKVKKEQNQHLDPTTTPKQTNGSTSVSTNEASTRIDRKKNVEEFIKKYAIVKVKKPGKKDWVVMILDEDNNRHVEITSTNLEEKYAAFVEDTYPPDTVKFLLNNIKHIMACVKNTIPRLTKSSLRCLEPHQVMFMNGFFDVKERKFCRILESERNQYYTTFSFDMDYTEHFNKPKVFSRLLLDALADNQEAVVLAYQQIGAIFTPIPTLKKIFLFQGASNAGKTRIGNIIAKCMPEDDTLVLNNISELTKDKLDSSPLRLVLIKELSKNKLYAKQIATLKALSDGSADTAFTKILMSTNYPIYTDEDGSIEPALRNRLSTLPFPKPMMNSDLDVSCFEDVHFENEKQGIIIWALQAFSEVLNNNNKFYKDFEPNICVDAENDQGQFGDEEGVQPVVKDYGRRVISTKEIIEQLFDLSDEVNEEMTAKLIMDAVNNFSPEDKTRVKQEAVVRGKLSEVFGKEELKSRRIKGNTCYNLNWKSKE